MNTLPCPVCRASLQVKTAEGRKSHKAFLMLVCATDGRHFRGFIFDVAFIAQVVGSAIRVSQATKAGKSR